MSKLLRYIFILVAVVGFLGTTSVFAYVASSSSYRIQFDSINIGGTFSTSTNYSLEDTAGEIATGNASSSSFTLHAGYQQMNESSISVSSPADVTLSPSITDTGAATGSAAWTVITDNAAGYQLTIEAASSPALTSGANSFADYTPAGAVPDFTFSVGSSDSEFGFSPEGSDIVARYQDNGSTCNTGSSDTSDRCWDALSTTAATIAQSTSSNQPSGTATTVKFQAEVGSSATQAAGTYSAAVTVTATAL